MQKRVPTAVKITVSVVVLAALMVGVVALYANVPAEGEPGVVIDFPEEWDFGWNVIKWIDGVVDWVVINWEPFFIVIRTIVLGILIPFRDFLLWLPWWLVIIGTGLLAWRVVSARFGVVAVLFLGFISFMGLIDLLMLTLAITLTSTLLCVAVGLPLGIIAAKSDRFEGMLRPILDAMQTMPSFVYLIPALMLFGLGMTPAVMATLIYAIPPIIRLTNLGIRQVDASVVEAGQSFGATPWQLLLKVQVPLALPTILAGLNQTVMMALAMVVLASMIGASGLGVEVLNGLARIQPGRGFIAGIAIVFAAIILDRVSQGFAKRPETRPAT
jgi:glycine betaine/proline transport system permease protein